MLEEKIKKYRWIKEGKIVAKFLIYYYVPVSITVLGLFQILQEAMNHFNRVARQIKV